MELALWVGWTFRLQANRTAPCSRTPLALLLCALLLHVLLLRVLLFHVLLLRVPLLCVPLLFSTLKGPLSSALCSLVSSAEMSLLSSAQVLLRIQMPLGAGATEVLWRLVYTLVPPRMYTPSCGT